MSPVGRHDHPALRHARVRPRRRRCTRGRRISASSRSERWRTRSASARRRCRGRAAGCGARRKRVAAPRPAVPRARCSRMVDRIETYLPDGGPKGSGSRRPHRRRSAGVVLQGPLYQDPVWPGSLGLESFLQLLKYVAWNAGIAGGTGWQPVCSRAAHAPCLGLPRPGAADRREVTVILEVTEADDDARH